MEQDATNEGASREQIDEMLFPEITGVPSEPLKIPNLEEYLKKLTEEANVDEDNLSLYWPLRRAIIENDWKSVEDFINNKDHPQALTDKITETSNTLFHGIAASNNDAAILLLHKLLPKSVESLDIKDVEGNTVLVTAAAAGNTEAAKLFVKARCDLPNLFNKYKFLPLLPLLPIHVAAIFGRKEMVEFLLPLTTVLQNTDDQNSAAGRVLLIIFLIESALYGIALDFLKNKFLNLKLYPLHRKAILMQLALKPLEFESGSGLGRWQRLIYHCIPAKGENISSSQTKTTYFLDHASENEDVENPAKRSKNCSTKSKLSGLFFGKIGEWRQKLNILFWNALMPLVPRIKRMAEKKLMHIQVHEIVKTLCGGTTWNYKQASEILKDPVLTAARFGIYEIVNEIFKVYENSVFFVDENGNNLFRLAVLHRRERVFNLIYQMGTGKEWLGYIDNSGNTIFHLVGQLVPSNKIAGAALQMQREVQWFKAVKNLVPSFFRGKPNYSTETALEVFEREHKTLVQEGQKWMKETATSCTVVAALIITVVFAAAFTVPGGTATGGLPTFLHEPSFLVFAISDALALFSSTSSLLMFLGILTARYSTEDFLVSLPKKLIIGLITLFFSIASMMVAFGATFYTVLSHPWNWTVIPISLLGCLPVTLFALLQFPLLVEMILSTYGPSIFKPK